MKIQWRITLWLALFFLLTAHSDVIGEEELPINRTDQVVEQKKQTNALREIKVAIFNIDIPDKEKAGSSNFKPGIAKVKTGDKIVWTNKDSRTHFITSMSTCDYPGSNCNKAADDSEDEEEEEAEEESGSELASDTFYFTSDYLESGKTFTYTFEKVGVYKYYCFTHPLEMSGFIEVEE